MRVTVVLLCAVALGGPEFDRKTGLPTGKTSERLAQPGEQVHIDIDTAEALIAAGAARVPMSEAAAPAPPPKDPPKEPPKEPGDAPPPKDAPPA